MANKNRFAKRLFAVMMAAVTTATTVAPNVFASDAGPAGEDSANGVTTHVEIAPVEEPQEEAKTEAAVPEEKEGGAKQEMPAEDTGAESGAPADGKGEAQEAEEDIPVKGVEADAEDAGQDADEGKTEDAEKAAEGAEQKEDAQKQDEGKEKPAGEEKPAEAEKPAEGEKAEDEEKPVEKIESGRVTFHFDEGAGVVKVVISSDEGAHAEDPSITLSKESGKAAEADFRNGSVREMSADGGMRDGKLEIELEAGTEVSVIAEAAEGFENPDVRLKKNGSDVEKNNEKKDDGVYSFSFDAEEGSLDAEISFAEKEVPQEEAQEKDAAFALKLGSAGGSVTVDVTDKDGAKASYDAVMDENGKVSVSGGAEAKDGYDIFVGAGEGAEVTVTANADEAHGLTSFVITTPDGKEEHAEPRGIVDMITGLFKKEKSVSRTFTIEKGLTTAEVYFINMPEFKAEKKVGDTTVKIHADKGVFPAGTSVEVTRLGEDAEKAFEEKVREQADGKAVYVTDVFDITFKDKDGNEIQPNGMVNVEFVNAAEENYEMGVFHAKDDSITDIEEIGSTTEGKNVSIENNEFSPYALTASSGRNESEPNWASFEKGTRPTIPDASFTLSSYASYWYDNFGYTPGGGDPGMTVSYTSSLTKDGEITEIGYSICFDPKRNGTGMTGFTTDNVFRLDVDMIVKAMYYGVGDGKQVLIDILSKGNPNHTGSASSNARLNIVTHSAAAEIYARLGWARKSAVGDAFSMGDQTGDLKKDTYAFINAIANLPTPDGYYVYLAGFNDAKRQDFGVLSKVAIESAKAKLIKKSAQPNITDGSTYFSLEGAIYGVYSDAACTKKVAQFVTDAKGTSNVVELPLGTYYVKEIKAPKGYSLDTDTVKPVTLTKDNSNKPAEVEFADYASTNDVKIQKVSGTSAMTDNNPCYSLIGANFKIKRLVDEKNNTWEYVCGSENEDGSIQYHQKGTPAVLVTKSNGYTQVIKGLPLGKYKIIETKAPKGFTLPNIPEDKLPVRDLTHVSKEVVTFNMSDPPEGDPIGIIIEKRSSAVSTEGAHPLSGAVFELAYYKDYLAADAFKADGKPNSASIDRKWYLKTVLEDGKYVARFTPAFLDNSGKYKSDKFYVNSNNEEILPLGTFTVREVKAPDGYANDPDFNGSKFFLGQVVWDNEKKTPVTQPIQGSVSIDNTALGISVADPEVKPGIGTSVKDNTTGTQMVYAGEDKSVDVAMTDTISYTKLIANGKYAAEGYIVDSAEAAKVKAGNPNMSAKELFETAKPLTDASGKPVTGKTEFTASSSGNGSTDVMFNFKVDNSFAGKTYVVFEKITYETGAELFHADVDDSDQTFVIPEIGTSASKVEITEDGKAKVVDTVSFKGLSASETFKITGYFVDRNTGEEVKVDGKRLESVKTFKPTGKRDANDNVTGTTEVTFEFDPDGFEGRQLVVYEEITLGDKTIATHKDSNDSKQFVDFSNPKGKTTAADDYTKDHIAKVDKKGYVSITDRFEYEDLTSGTEYDMDAYIVGKDDGNTIESTITGVKGENCTVTNEDGKIKFTPSGNGAVLISFKFKAAALAGKDVVVFEKVTKNGRNIIVHENIDDKDQTIRIPGVKTHAKDRDTGLQIAPAVGERIIEDEVKYSGLTEGKEYAVGGEVHVQPYTDAEGNKIAEHKIDAQMVDKDGNPVEKTTFTAKNSEGSVMVYFKVNASELAGHSAVVFESLYYGDVEIAVHNNIKDKDQTVHYPSGRTTAYDKATNGHIAKIDEDGKAHVGDRFIFNGMDTGEESEMDAYVVRKSNKEKVNATITNVEGENCTVKLEDGKIKFTPTSEDGSVNIEFEFDASKLKGEEVVVFEKVTRNGEDLIIHEDINDKDQTIRFPGVKTHAKDKDTGLQIAPAAGERIIEDEVEYSGLIPGDEYEYSVKGDVHVPAYTDINGNKVEEHTLDAQMVDKDGNPIEKTTFKAEQSSGSVTVYFKVNASELAGQSAVVFEKLYCGDVEIAVHNNINDEDQTVRYPEGKTTACDKATNDHIAKIGEDNKANIGDRFIFKNMDIGEESELEARVVRKSDKGNVNATIVKVEGENCTAKLEDGKIKFTPTGRDGSVNIEFEFDASELKGQEVVVFEKVRRDDNEIIIHENIEDKDQTIIIPDIKTNAKDKETGEQVAPAEGERIIEDTVDYSGLIVDKDYAIGGDVYTQPYIDENGNEVAERKIDAQMVDENGNPIEKTVFKAEQPNGSVKVYFKVNASELEGQTAVVFETLYYNDIDIAVHANINDEAQTVHYPSGRTTARDQETGEQIAVAKGYRIIEDDFKYKNVIPGRAYDITGSVWARGYVDADGNTVAEHEIDAQMVDRNGNPIDKHTFTAEQESGVETLYFKVDASKLAGQTTVVFETMKYNDIAIIVHANIDDEAQTVRFPSGGTTLRDAKTGGHTSFAEKEMVLQDDIEYHNLIVGKEYTPSGTLMDKATERPLIVNGKPVVSEPMTFVPKTPDGKVTVTFRFDGSALQGKTLVAFEKVTVDGKEVFVHENIKDEAQTVHIPKIGTTATDKADGDHTLAKSGTVTINDSVKYENINTEKTYKFVATLMDVKSEKRVGVNGKVVTNTVTEKPGKADGTITVPLTFDVTNVESGDYVVFEKVYEIDEETGKEHLIAVHEDFKDKNQTVKVPERPGKKRVQTGDFPVVPVAVGGAIIFAAGILVVLRKKQNG